MLFSFFPHKRLFTVKESMSRSKARISIGSSLYQSSCNPTLVRFLWFSLSSHHEICFSLSGFRLVVSIVETCQYFYLVTGRSCRWTHFEFVVASNRAIWALLQLIRVGWEAEETCDNFPTYEILFMWAYPSFEGNDPITVIVHLGVVLRSGWLF